MMILTRLKHKGKISGRCGNNRRERPNGEVKPCKRLMWAHLAVDVGSVPICKECFAFMAFGRIEEIELDDLLSSPLGTQFKLELDLPPGDWNLVAGSTLKTVVDPVEDSLQDLADGTVVEVFKNKLMFAVFPVDSDYSVDIQDVVLGLFKSFELAQTFLAAWLQQPIIKSGEEFLIMPVNVAGAVLAVDWDNCGERGQRVIKR